jgi:hypothetical protein
MNDERDEKSLEQRAAQAFEASVAGLDGQTRSRLRQARMRALAAGGPGASWLAATRRYAWMPASVMAALLAAWALWGPEPAGEAGLAAAPMGDLDILLAEEDLAVFEELEFYTWLEDQPEVAVPEANGDGIG